MKNRTRAALAGVVAVASMSAAAIGGAVDAGAQTSTCPDRPGQTLKGNGDLIRNGSDHITFSVTDAEAAGIMQVTVKRQPRMWWKQVIVKDAWNGTHYTYATAGGEEIGVATVPATSATSTMILDFWKAGFLNSGKHVTAYPIDAPSYVGCNLTFEWVRA